jgi:hypothetical protein
MLHFVQGHRAQAQILDFTWISELGSLGRPSLSTPDLVTKSLAQINTYAYMCLFIFIFDLHLYILFRLGGNGGCNFLLFNRCLFNWLAERHFFFPYDIKNQILLGSIRSTCCVRFIPGYKIIFDHNLGKFYIFGRNWEALSPIILTESSGEFGERLFASGLKC